MKVREKSKEICMKKKVMSLKWMFCLFATCFFVGCAHPGDDDIREVPVTNNPTLIPRTGNGMGVPY